MNLLGGVDRESMQGEITRSSIEHLRILISILVMLNKQESWILDVALFSLNLYSFIAVVPE